MSAPKDPDFFDDAPNPAGSEEAPPERRGERRTDVIRPVLYLSQDIDRFRGGIILNISANGAGLHTTTLLYPGAEIYIVDRTNKKAIFNGKPNESAFGAVIWCKEIAGAYRVGIRLNGWPLYFSWLSDTKTSAPPEDGHV